MGIITEDTILDDIGRREGTKYTDRPTDRGGPTRYGVTIPGLKDYRAHLGDRRPVTAMDIQQLTPGEARKVLAWGYIQLPNFHYIDDGQLRALMVDSAVNHGRGRASRWLQIAMGMTKEQQDGKIGEKSLAELRKHPPAKLYREVLAIRVEFYGEIVTKDDTHTQEENAWGWSRRIGEFIRGMP